MSPTPLFGRVLVKAVDDESRLWTPPGAAVATRRAVVVEAGKDVEELEVADVILFPPARAVEFRVDDETYYVIDEREVFVILERAALFRPTLSA